MDSPGKVIETALTVRDLEHAPIDPAQREHALREANEAAHALDQFLGTRRIRREAGESSRGDEG